jgi:hypothetical protein
MTTAHKNILQREWPLAIKISIIILSIWFIFKQVLVKDDLDDFIAFYTTLAADPFNWFLFFLVDFMMGINWYLEAFKWKVLVDKYEKITLFQSMRATLSGITVSFFTPNRIGEFAGRVLHISPQSRLMAILATFIGSASQLLVTCLFGLFGLALYLPSFLNLDQIYSILFLVAAIIICGILLNMFFHFGFLTKILHHLKMLRRFDRYLAVFEQYSRQELISIFLLSTLRYLVFTFQFIILVKMMGTDLPVFQLFGLISIVYLLLSFLPSIFLTELPVRGSVALYVIGQYSQNHLGILCASFSIWMINLVIPALIGAVSILYVRIIK